MDHEPQSWFLLEEEGRLFLDAACDHGAFGYSWLIELNAEEQRQFTEQSRAYIGWLAQDIHNGVPILEASQSPTKVATAAPIWASRSARPSSAGERPDGPQAR
ncbi:hypothetical protein [Novosphingobium terrae]|uniref:hypothetical protein n=1 Tax=Novosphingobium terrae TaxID=2726189 RepID=UPI001980ABEE|nr:hypothetical protein [Novosphingobium terrae]